MAWKPDGSLLAGGRKDGSLFLWDPRTGVRKGMWCLGLEGYMMQSFATIGGVQFIDGGRKLLFRILEGTVEMYDFESNLKQQFTRGPEDTVTSCPRGETVCSADSKILVVPDADGALRLWNLQIRFL